MKKAVISVKMVFDIKLFLLIALSIATAVAEKDHFLCGHRWEDNGDFYSAATDVVQPINIRGYSGQADLLISDLTTKNIASIITSLPTGLFKTDMAEIISQGDFCNAANDKIHVADMDGDHYDDLLCRKEDGSFTVRYYRRKRFSPEEQFAKDFQCGIYSSTTILIGDFDGNHANDIICYDPTATTLDSSAVYFSQINCHQNHVNLHHRHRAYGRSRRDYYNSRRYGGHSDCHKGLPMMTALPAGVAALCIPNDGAGPGRFSILDANGDGKDDIACFQGTTNNVATYLSKGSRTDIFSGAATPAVGITGCSYTGFVIPADVDGDGDDDLLCANSDVSQVVPLRYSYFTDGSYQSAFAATSPACTSDAFCSDAILSGPIVAEYRVADFNGDGKDDLMCRFDDGLGTAKPMHTRIVFAEYFA